MTYHWSQEQITSLVKKWTIQNPACLFIRLPVYTSSRTRKPCKPTKQTGVFGTSLDKADSNTVNKVLCLPFGTGLYKNLPFRNQTKEKKTKVNSIILWYPKHDQGLTYIRGLVQKWQIRLCETWSSECGTYEVFLLFLDVTPSSLRNRYWHFEETYWLYFHVNAENAGSTIFRNVVNDHYN
jgi:hypothetical protein